MDPRDKQHRNEGQPVRPNHRRFKIIRKQCIWSVCFWMRLSKIHTRAMRLHIRFAEFGVRSGLAIHEQRSGAGGWWRLAFVAVSRGWGVPGPEYAILSCAAKLKAFCVPVIPTIAAGGAQQFGHQQASGVRPAHRDHLVPAAAVLDRCPQGLVRSCAGRLTTMVPRNLDAYESRRSTGSGGMG